MDDLLASLNHVADELLKSGLPELVVATWLHPILVHLQPDVRGLEIPDRLLALAAVVGVDLTAAEEA